MFIPINFPANYILDHVGLKKGIMIGLSFIVIGVFVRCLINKSLIYVILG